MTSFFEGAAASICLGAAAAAATEEEADRGSTPTPTKEVEERTRDSSRGGGSKCNRNNRLRVYVWKVLPVVHVLPELKKFYPSVIVRQLMGLGIAPLATELERRNWVKITQDPWVLETIQGYRVPFSQQPYQPYPPRALTHSQAEEALMQQEIQSMLEKHAIEETTPRGHGFLSTIFLVPKKDGGQRPVINLKSLNKFVYTEHFKIEGIHILRDLLRAGDWMTKVDLKDAYFMVPIHEEDRAFLKFSFKEKVYQFKCLPFGLACAPWVFTKTLKATCCSVETTGNATDRLHRRHPYPGRVQGAGMGPFHRPSIFAREPRVCDKQTQVCPGTHTVSGVPRFLSELSSARTKSSGREDEEDQGRDPRPFGRRSGYSQKAISAARQTTSSNQGNSPGPFVLPQSCSRHCREG